MSYGSNLPHTRTLAYAYAGAYRRTRRLAGEDCSVPKQLSAAPLHFGLLMPLTGYLVLDGTGPPDYSEYSAHSPSMG